MAKRKVNFQGQEVEAEVIEFEAEREPWSTYLLHDGTQLKIKNVLADVLRLDGVYSPTGEPQYVIQGTPVISIVVPEMLKKRE